METVLQEQEMLFRQVSHQRQIQVHLKNTLVFAGEGQSVLNPLLNNTDDIQSIIFSGLMKYDGNNKTGYRFGRKL